MKIYVALQHCVQSMEEHNGRLYVINALPLASVAVSIYIVSVVLWPCGNSQPLDLIKEDIFNFD